MARSFIARIESNGAYVYVYDAKTGSRIRAVGSAGATGTNVAVQTNGNIVAITDNRGITTTYDAESGRRLKRL